MVETKYYERIVRFQSDKFSASSEFNISDMAGGGFAAKAGIWLFQHPWFFTNVLRDFLPVLKLGRFVAVTRYDDVKEVLELPDVFEVPFGLEMKEMSGGENFILGMKSEEDSAAYERQKRHMGAAFLREDIENIVRPMAARFASEILDSSNGRLNAVADLIARVPTKICEAYYGVPILDEDAFADWSLSLSVLFFGDPFGKEHTRRLALAAAPRLQNLLIRAIALAKAGKIGADTVLGRLVRLQQTEADPPSDGEIRSILMGMMTGFVPTNTVAGAHMLSILFEKEDALRLARQAASENNDGELWRILTEAMRFRPLNFGPFRYCNRTYRLNSGAVIPAGSTVLASTLSAMLDPRRVPRPAQFDPSRSPDQYMFFGHGAHACYGAAIAEAQITQTLKALLLKPGLRPVAGPDGKLTRLGPIPRRLTVEFDQPAEPPLAQSLITICAPLAGGASASGVEEDIKQLGNPAAPAAAAAFEAAGRLHFASFSVIRGEGDEPTYAVLEMSADGDPQEAIEALASSAGALLRPIFEKGCELKPGEDLGAFLKNHSIDVGYRKNIPGLLFCGTPGMSVKRIRLEDALQDKLSRTLETKLSRRRDGEALRVLNEVRAELREEGGYDWAFRAEPAPFLSIADKPVDMPRLLFSPRILAALGALAVLTMLLAGAALSGGAHKGALFEFASFLDSILFGLGSALVAALLAAGGFILALRWKEKKDVAADSDPDPSAIRAIMENENKHVQNHMTTVSIMKPGLLRKFTLRLMFFYVTRRLALFLRPGYLNEIGTIHFARFILLPKTNKFVFFSNYAGGWEAYMEDFITRAHRGLTGVWSNTKEFPRTWGLLFGGSQDGDRFKRWARRQQIPTLFWFSAYPDLAPERIRVNAAIRDGFARARTESEAAAWRSLFGSQPQPKGGKALEDYEVQALVFSGMGKLMEAECLLVRLPEDNEGGAHAWLADYFSETRPLDARITFGDAMPAERATYVALTASGLAKLGIGADETSVRDSFPAAFTHGMAAPWRARVLADVGESSPGNWDWGGAHNSVDAAILIYAKDKAGLDAARALETANMERNGAQLVHRVETKLTFPARSEANPDGFRSPPGYFRETPSVEPFGFADGISQPLVKGTRKWYENPSELHGVEAGEMILGYLDNRGFYPPTPQVTAKQDPYNDLPLPPALLLDRWPDFGGDVARAPRDLGRNGSFLVVRQLEQRISEFNAYLESAAASLREEWPDMNITADWLAAKMVGRWKDGTSLVRNPSGTERPQIDNDFLLGRDDPQGLKCPLGAHIRRANPRDSFKPGDETQIQISNRHRIFRVGRPYVETDAAGERQVQGLLFLAINAEIERQFEFLQQTWITSPYFQGLGRENDPLVAPQRYDGTFTIPTHRGPITLRNMSAFVVVRGGAYFFLPSRSALRFLSRPKT